MIDDEYIKPSGHRDYRRSDYQKRVMGEFPPEPEPKSPDSLEDALIDSVPDIIQTVLIWSGSGRVGDLINELPPPLRDLVRSREAGEEFVSDLAKRGVMSRILEVVKVKVRDRVQAFKAVEDKKSEVYKLKQQVKSFSLLGDAADEPEANFHNPSSKFLQDSKVEHNMDGSVTIHRRYCIPTQALVADEVHPDWVGLPEETKDLVRGKHKEALDKMFIE